MHLVSTLLRQVAMQWQMGMYLHNSLPKIECSKSICTTQIKEGEKRSNNSQFILGIASHDKLSDFG